jgi:hypothetical protein
MSTPYYFTQDIQIHTKNYPGFEYNPDETAGVWHEDREINGVMYRAANASYNDLKDYWFQPNGSQPSYAIAQNTDGSINYLYMPAMGSDIWTTWQGTGQPPVYNAINYGLNVNDPTNGMDNATALAAAINAALNGSSEASGGIVFHTRGSLSDKRDP